MKKTIMVIDDEEAVLTMTKLRLERSGYLVVTSQTGTEAIEAISRLLPQLKSSLAAVLLDLTLEDMSGLQVLVELKRLSADIPVIMVTGSHNEEEARLAMNAGALEYITKPVDFDYLLNILSLQDSAE